jgi:hypothetical protein
LSDNEEILNQPVVEVLEGLSRRSRGCLENRHIFSLRDLLNFTGRELLRTRNFGPRSLREIEGKLRVRGLRLKSLRQWYEETRERERQAQIKFERERLAWNAELEWRQSHCEGDFIVRPKGIVREKLEVLARGKGVTPAELVHDWILEKLGVKEEPEELVEL